MLSAALIVILAHRVRFVAGLAQLCTTICRNVFAARLRLCSCRSGVLKLMIGVLAACSMPMIVAITCDLGRGRRMEVTKWAAALCLPQSYHRPANACSQKGMGDIFRMITAAFFMLYGSPLLSRNHTSDKYRRYSAGGFGRGDKGAQSSSFMNGLPRLYLNSLTGLLKL